MNFLTKKGISTLIFMLITGVVFFTACSKTEVMPENVDASITAPDVYLKNGVLRFKDFETYKKIAETLQSNKDLILNFIEENEFDNSMYIDYLNSGKSEFHVVSEMVMADAHAALLSSDGFVVVGNTLNYFDGKSEYLFENFTEANIENIRNKIENLKLAEKHDVKINTNLKYGSSEDAIVATETFNDGGETIIVRISHMYSRYVWTNTAKMRLTTYNTNYSPYYCNKIQVSGMGYYVPTRTGSSPSFSNVVRKWQIDVDYDDDDVTVIVYFETSSKGKFCWQSVIGNINLYNSTSHLYKDYALPNGCQL